MAKAIDLGEKLGGSLIAAISDSKDKVHYPSLHIESDDTDLLNLPDSGKCEIQYKVTSRTHREDKHEGKSRKHCSVTLEVRSIAPPPGKDYYGKGGKKEEYGNGARKALKDYFDKN